MPTQPGLKAWMPILTTLYKYQQPMEQGQAHQAHHYMLQLGPEVSYDNNYDFYIQLLYCIASAGSGVPDVVVGVVVVVIIALLVVTALTTVIIVLALKLRRYLISYYTK